MTIPDFPAAPSAPNGEKLNISSKSYATLWLLSLFLGAFGADRFYLGKTKTALAKLLTLGGLGFWWLFDIGWTVAGKQSDNSGTLVTPTKTEQIATGILSFVLVTAFLVTNGESTESDSSPTAAPSAASTIRETFRMVDVIGLSGDEAVEALAALDFKLADIEFVSSAGAETTDFSAYVVCAQTPGPGALANSLTVQLEVEETCEQAVEPTPSETASAEPTVSPSEAPIEYVKVENVVGLDYQTAQDIWRAQGLVVLPATDATGQGRWAFIDSNWIVVGQDISPGTKVEVGTPITASIKKFGE